MINPKELRIGNFVYVEKYKSKEQYITDVGSVGHWGIDGMATHSQDIEGDECWPIPLTDDRLLKFGFEQDRARLVLKTPLLQKCYFASSPYVGIIDGTTSIYLYHIDGMAIGKPINFVHQLQNLFYCLTGQELDVKL